MPIKSKELQEALDTWIAYNKVSDNTAYLMFCKNKFSNKNLDSFSKFIFTFIFNFT